MHMRTLATIDEQLGHCILSNQGKLSEAEPLYREALRCRRETLGDTHPDTLRSMDELERLILHAEHVGVRLRNLHALRNAKAQRQRFAALRNAAPRRAPSARAAARPPRSG